MSLKTFSSPQTENAVTIVVAEAIDDTLCIGGLEAEKLYELIFPLIKEGKNVILDFQNIEESTPAFIDLTIGELYEHFPAEQIEKLLSFINTDPEVAFDIETVVKWTKEYLKDPERHIQALREVMGGAYE